MLSLKTVFVYLVLIFSLVFSYAEDSITYHARGSGGAVAAEDSRAVEAGIAMLKNDGNATDAAVAVMLAASVVDYGMFSIGSEIPFMIYDKKSETVKTLSGLGSAPLDESSMKIYYKEGIPADGGMRAVPVPGAVHLFFTALIEYGTMSFRSKSDFGLVSLFQITSKAQIKFCVNLLRQKDVPKNIMRDYVIKLESNFIRDYDTVSYTHLRAHET